MTFIKSLQNALATAQRDVNLLSREAEYWRLRTAEAQKTTAFVAEQAR